MEHIFAGLNDKQIEAVKAGEGPVLVISGPGSGKTRCLTHRIAYLIASGVRPEEILAVTFTNKAAGEIKDRVAKLLKVSKRNFGTPTLGTFHSLGLRMLRKEIAKLGYGENFVIADTDDQHTLIKRILADLEMDPKKFNPQAILGRISKLKTELISPEQYSPTEFFPGIVAKIYRRYQSDLQKMNAVDFDDLISLPIKIFHAHPEILEKYQNQWRYILVDEYQDTSHDQYVLIGLLAAKYRNLFCIGDDAQSIYMFREADIRNILNFQKDYPDGQIIMLEQNYRSTKNILAAAQAIITNNKQQITKELWTENPTGDKIIARETINERHEADFVIRTIEQLLAKGKGMNDIAVLYRTHAQSRVIEESLIAHGYPYQIVGGIKFYARAEVKDLLAYLRILANPHDTISFERIANVPVRGIGKVTLERIVQTGHTDVVAATYAASEGAPPKQLTALKTLAVLLKDLREGQDNRTLTGTIKAIIKKTKYEEYLRAQYADRLDNVEERIENIQELLTVASKYDPLGTEALTKFLEDITLLQDTDKLRDAAKRITLMTMHAAKGLEFPVVFIIGMEEGLFPHSRTLFEPRELEEERRLCYVAITRAKEQLYITFAKFRRIFGSAQANLPSRFLGEIPQHVLHYQFIEDYDDNETIDY